MRSLTLWFSEALVAALIAGSLAPVQADPRIPLTRSEIVGRLRSFHSPQWGFPYTESARLKIGEQLLKLYMNPNTELPPDEPRRADLALRALGEYGKFAVDDSGHLFEQAEAFYRGVIAKMDEIEGNNPLGAHRMLIIRSLYNTQSAQGAELIAQVIEPKRESNPLALQALGRLFEVKRMPDPLFATHEQLDSPQEFIPGDRGLPPSRRAASEEWKKAAKQAEKAFGRILRSKTEPREIAEIASQARAKLEQYRRVEKGEPVRYAAARPEPAAYRGGNFQVVQKVSGNVMTFTRVPASPADNAADPMKSSMPVLPIALLALVGMLAVGAAIWRLRSG